MDRLIYFLIVLCMIVIKSNLIITHESESLALEPSETITTTPTAQDNESEYENENNSNDKANDSVEIEQRSIASYTDTALDLPVDNDDRHAAFRKRAKPLKNIFMGIYRNYKSTYLGNKTFAEYKQSLRKKAEQNDDSPTEEEELAKVEEKQANHDTTIKTHDIDDIQIESTEANNIKAEDSMESETIQQSEIIEAKSENTKKKKKKRNNRRKKHAKHHRTQAKKENIIPDSPIYTYDFGPAVNMSLDMNNDIVKIHLDGENLRNIIQGRWLQKGSEGRGKKYDMMTKVLPLFIIPFLIQSAIVPFLVMKLKLLLMKSILVGKLAIFLLVISAIRNSSKGMQTYEVAPSYWAGEPSRRSELVAASSSAAYNGYRVEGKPTAWIN